MSGVLAAVRTMVGLAAAEDGDTQFLLPSGVHDELAAYRLRRQIEEARQEVSDARAARVAAEDALAVTREPLARADADLVGVESALDRARTAREVDAQARREALEQGGTVDPALAEAAELALREVRDARRAQVAAKDVLPILEQRVQEAQCVVQRAQERIDQAIAQVMVATLAQRIKDAHAAAARLAECYFELASLSELFLRARSLGLPTGTVPTEMVPRPPEFQFTADELQPGMAPWRDYAHRLKQDPNATFQ